jgi:hypothetical protein
VVWVCLFTATSIAQLERYGLDMAARKKGRKKTPGGRGSKEAVQKRRAARNLNTILTGGSRVTHKLDGRTEKRRQRLVSELIHGRSGRALKPIDFVNHVNELLELGESVSSLKKQGVKARKTELTPEIEAAIKWTQEAYEFDPNAWKMIGVTLDTPKKSRRKAAGGSRAARKRR